MRVEGRYVASASVARRTGMIESRYRTKDGRFILSEKDLRSVRLTMKPEEYVNGLDVELITQEEASTLIREGGYTLGTKGMNEQEAVAAEPTLGTEENEEVTVEDVEEAAEETEEENQEATEETTEEDNNE